MNEPGNDCSVTPQNISRNIIWSISSKIATFGLKFVTVPILARILTPEEFGSVAVALTTIQFLAMIGAAGFGAALIIQPDENRETLASVFWMNLATGITIAALLAVFAEPAATLLGAPGAASLFRIMAPLIPLQMSGEVFYSILAKRMKFRQEAAWSMLSDSLSSILAVIFAFTGFGVFSLVFQLFTSAIMRLIGLIFISKYMPLFVFNMKNLANLIRFGSGIMFSEIFNFLTFQSPIILISRFLGIIDAGAFSVAGRVSSIPNQIVLSAIMSVLFPTFGAMARDRGAQALLISTRLTSIVLAPIMFGLWAVAEPVMPLVFGPQWAWAWPVLGLTALSTAVLTPCGVFIPYLKGGGHGDTLFWWSLFRAGITTTTVGISAMLGSLTVTLTALCIANITISFLYCFLVFKIAGTNILRSIFLAYRPLLIAGLMAIIVKFSLDYGAKYLETPLSRLSIGLLTGIFIYTSAIFFVERSLLQIFYKKIRRRL
ncbi:lipopolysaccharide biosynthesis protein [Pararhodospirillum oryzae]|uniref:lipopolysaccharide biosynthesis protein n=1 Tax=Pararhodospirillum oryzae TaxID=478448 RepID=UPI0011BE9E73|nr:lipopolysaccharide biosynthesis protein [Pararhodospirillum oryzae]